jgi:chemosensory pili system protein ChpA (sensor histidine kinase/response regulator)
MSTASKRRILLLEDSADLRALLERQLVRAGYEVLSAEDAVEAGKLVVERTPDLIIADIQLPYMSGDEFIAALRRDPAVRDIPVIFLSVDAQLEAHAKRLGAVAYFDKNVSSERLLEVVEFYAGG